MPSRNDLIDQLIDILKLETRAMGQLQAAMGRNRIAFVSISASPLLNGIENLEPQWAVLEGLEERREALLETLVEEGLAGTQITGKFRVSKLIPELPAYLGRRLRDAADAADTTSRRIRAETNASARLLRVSQQANDGVIRALTRSDEEELTSYDRKAKSVGTGTPGGRLVLGTA